MKILLGILCLQLASVLWGYANVDVNSSRYKLSEEIYRLSVPKDVFIKSIINQVESGMPQLFHGDLPADKVEGVRRVVKQYATAVVNDPELEKKLIQGYAGMFSEEELKELLKFYQSDVGQKYVKSQAQLSSLLQDAIQQTSPKYNRILQQEIGKVLSGKQ